jgi:hypothetical protein
LIITNPPTQEEAMSQSIEKVEMNIEVLLTMDDHNEPQAVTVTGTGNIPRSAVRAIAEEALEARYGSVNHGYRVQMSPELEEDDNTVFDIYKSFIGTRKYRDFTGTPVNE